MSYRKPLIAAVIAFCFAGTVLFTCAADLEIKEQWSGIIREDALKAQLPVAVRTKEKWEKLWKLLKRTEALPAVDFEKELIVVSSVSGPNRGRVGKLTLDDKGNVDVVAMSTRMGGPGFGYVLLRMARDGIKSVDGKALDADGKVKGAGGIAAGEVKVKSSTSGLVGDNALKALAPAPAITDSATLAKLWTAWGNLDHVSPHDFQKELVLVVFADGPNSPIIQKVMRDEKGNVEVQAIQTERGGPGFGYALLTVDREGILSVHGQAIAAPKQNPGEAVLNGEQIVPHIAYDGYFVKNNTNQNAARTLLALANQEQFDRNFGVAAVMQDKSKRLPAEIFPKQLVVSIITRGTAVEQYAVESITLKDDTLMVRYQAKAAPSNGTATFASPLILSVPRAGIKKVFFVENGQSVGDALVVE